MVLKKKKWWIPCVLRALTHTLQDLIKSESALKEALSATEEHLSVSIFTIWSFKATLGCHLIFYQIYAMNFSQPFSYYFFSQSLHKSIFNGNKEYTGI